MMMQRTRVYLVRHGQVEGHEEKRYNGQVNVPLTPLGRAQSERIRERLKIVPLKAVYSSDLDRSRYCAELVAAEHGLEVRASADLRELHVGDWEGRTWADLQESFPDDWRARLENLVEFRVPGGESLMDAAERIRPALARMVEEHRGEEIAVVAHGGVNRIVLLDAIGAPLRQAFSIEQDYGCVNIVDYYADGHSVVRLLNGSGHQADGSLGG